MSTGVITVEDPASTDVGVVLASHHAFVAGLSPPDDIHALDVSGLLDASVTLFGFRRDGTLLGIGALKVLGDRDGELKSMHTLPAARGLGVGAALLHHIVAIARDRGLARLSLETGAMDGFAPAWSLYAGRGFVPCGPFASYAPSVNSRFRTLELENERGPGRT